MPEGSRAATRRAGRADAGCGHDCPPAHGAVPKLAPGLWISAETRGSRTPSISQSVRARRRTLAVGGSREEAAHMEVCNLSALDLAAALRRRELSATDALGAVLERAELIEGPLNPFAVRLDDRARRAAEAADAAFV